MISIIIPIYNGLEFLDECLQSVYSQTFKDYEILLGLNGHEINGETYNFLRTYQSDKLRVFQYEFANKSKTCNELIKECTYDIICVLDADDKWMPIKLERQLQYINDYDVVGTLCQYFGESSLKLELPVKQIRISWFNINPIINSSSMFHKKDAYWEDIFGVEDYEMWLRLDREGKTFFNVPEYLVFHRIHKSSAFNTNELQQENLQKIKEIYGIRG